MTEMHLSTFWSGERFSYIERLSLISALDCGHSVALYAFDDIENVPNDVDIRDAREIMPARFFIKHKKKNSYALGADLFQLFLLKKANHCWIDCDLVFRRPLKSDNVILGWENEKTLNNAVLKLPCNCVVLDEILQLAFANPIVAPRRPQKKAIQWVRWGLGISRKLENLELGLTGPRALTIFGVKHGFATKACPPKVFYPNSWQNAEDAFDSNVDLFERITDETVTVHLWNGRIRKYKDAPPPSGSYIDHECKRLGVATPANRSPSASKMEALTGARISGH